MSGHVISIPQRDADDTFRSRLRRELAARCARNPRYSIRAFAAFLDVDHASLSQIMRGIRACTAPTIRRLGARIGLSADEITRYMASEEVVRRHPRSLGPVQQLAADAAAALSNWCSFAILELMQLKEFRPDVRWMSRVLGIEPDEVQITLQQLIRLGFLQMKAIDQWVDLTAGRIYREDQFTEAVLERLTQRSLGAQRASARNVPDGPRVHGALTLAVTHDDVTRLLAAAQHLLDEIGNSTESAPARRATELYHFEVSCYPITRGTSTKDEEVS